MEEKTCNHCHTSKSIDEFNKNKRSPDGHERRCRECNKKLYEQNKEKRLNQKRKYYESNKDVISDQRAEYYKNNKDVIRSKHKQYYNDNKDEIISTNSEYKRNKLKCDSGFRILCNLRRRVFGAINGGYKSNTTLELIGCSIDELKTHLHDSAIENGYSDFDIENYSGEEYHIDHIKPCCSFDLNDPDQQRECFHYSNLQILTANENLIKGGH